MFSIQAMCEVFSVSRAGFYTWQNRPESRRKREDRDLLASVRSSFDASRETYGYRRVHHDLQDEGRTCGKNRVARLMRENGICPRTRKKFRITTDSRHDKPVHENHLDRQFNAPAPNQRWVSDITYIPTSEGWLFLAVVMDLYSRRIIGWSMSNRMLESLVTDALKMALFARKVKSGDLLMHSDRGSQYAGDSFQRLLALHGIACSMSRKGNCWDNAAMESFFHSLKTECVHQQRYKTRDEARKSIFDYIEVFYNRKRKHSYLDYKSPEQFEQPA